MCSCGPWRIHRNGKVGQRASRQWGPLLTIGRLLNQGPRGMQQGLGSEGAGSAQSNDLKGDFTSLGPRFLICQLPPGTLEGLSQLHRHSAAPGSALSRCP